MDKKVLEFDMRKHTHKLLGCLCSQFALEILLLLGLDFLLILLNLLQPKELLSLELIEFGNNVRNRVFDTRLNYFLKCIDPPVCDLDGPIQSDKRCL